MTPLSGNITQSSIEFLHSAQSTGSVGDDLTFALGPDMAAYGSLENKSIATATYPITMVEYEQNNYNKHP